MAAEHIAHSVGAAEGSRSAGPSRATPGLVPQGSLAGRSEIPLDRAVTLAGSSDAARLHLTSRTISKAHALFVVHTSGAAYVADLASRTGVVVNGKAVREATLHNGDLVQLGKFVFRYRQATVPAASDEDGPLPAGLDDALPAAVALPHRPLLAIDGRRLVVGRRPGNDVALPNDPAVSSGHAVVFQVNGQWTLRDLGSRTGTQVNGRPVVQQILGFGDRITVGGTTFAFRPAPVPEPAPDFPAEPSTAVISTAVISTAVISTGVISTGVISTGVISAGVVDPSTVGTLGLAGTTAAAFTNGGIARPPVGPATVDSATVQPVAAEPVVGDTADPIPLDFAEEFPPEFTAAATTGDPEPLAVEPVGETFDDETSDGETFHADLSAAGPMAAGPTDRAGADPGFVDLTAPTAVEPAAPEPADPGETVPAPAEFELLDAEPVDAVELAAASSPAAALPVAAFDVADDESNIDIEEAGVAEADVAEADVVTGDMDPGRTAAAEVVDPTDPTPEGALALDGIGPADRVASPAADDLSDTHFGREFAAFADVGAGPLVEPPAEPVPGPPDLLADVDDFVFVPDEVPDASSDVPDVLFWGELEPEDELAAATAADVAAPIAPDAAENEPVAPAEPAVVPADPATVPPEAFSAVVATGLPTPPELTSSVAIDPADEGASAADPFGSAPDPIADAEFVLADPDPVPADAEPVAAGGPLTPAPADLSSSAVETIPPPPDDAIGPADFSDEFDVADVNDSPTPDHAATPTPTPADGATVRPVDAEGAEVTTSADEAAPASAPPNAAEFDGFDAVEATAPAHTATPLPAADAADLSDEFDDFDLGDPTTPDRTATPTMADEAIPLMVDAEAFDVPGSADEESPEPSPTSAPPTAVDAAHFDVVEPGEAATPDHTATPTATPAVAAEAAVLAGEFATDSDEVREVATPAFPAVPRLADVADILTGAALDSSPFVGLSTAAEPAGTAAFELEMIHDEDPGLMPAAAESTEPADSAALDELAASAPTGLSRGESPSDGADSSESSAVFDPGETPRAEPLASDETFAAVDDFAAVTDVTLTPPADGSDTAVVAVDLVSAEPSTTTLAGSVDLGAFNLGTDDRATDEFERAIGFEVLDASPGVGQLGSADAAAAGRAAGPVADDDDLHLLDFGDDEPADGGGRAAAVVDGPTTSPAAGDVAVPVAPPRFEETVLEPPATVEPVGAGAVELPTLTPQPTAGQPMSGQPMSGQPAVGSAAARGPSLFGFDFEGGSFLGGMPLSLDGPPSPLPTAGLMFDSAGKSSAGQTNVAARAADAAVPPAVSEAVISERDAFPPAAVPGRPTPAAPVALAPPPPPISPPPPPPVRQQVPPPPPSVVTPAAVPPQVAPPPPAASPAVPQPPRMVMPPRPNVGGVRRPPTPQPSAGGTNPSPPRPRVRPVGPPIPGGAAAAGAGFAAAAGGFAAGAAAVARAGSGDVFSQGSKPIGVEVFGAAAAAANPTRANPTRANPTRENPTRPDAEPAVPATPAKPARVPAPAFGFAAAPTAVEPPAAVEPAAADEPVAEPTSAFAAPRSPADGRVTDPRESARGQGVANGSYPGGRTGTGYAAAGLPPVPPAGPVARRRSRAALVVVTLAVLVAGSCAAVYTLFPPTAEVRGELRYDGLEAVGEDLRQQFHLEQQQRLAGAGVRDVVLSQRDLPPAVAKGVADAVAGGALAAIGTGSPGAAQVTWDKSAVDLTYTTSDPDVGRVVVRAALEALRLKDADRNDRRNVDAQKAEDAAKNVGVMAAALAVLKQQQESQVVASETRPDPAGVQAAEADRNAKRTAADVAAGTVRQAQLALDAARRGVPVVATDADADPRVIDLRHQLARVAAELAEARGLSTPGAAAPTTQSVDANPVLTVLRKQSADLQHQLDARIAELGSPAHRDRDRDASAESLSLGLSRAKLAQFDADAAAKAADDKADALHKMAFDASQADQQRAQLAGRIADASAAVAVAERDQNEKRKFAEMDPAPAAGVVQPSVYVSPDRRPLLYLYVTGLWVLLFGYPLWAEFRRWVAPPAPSAAGAVVALPRPPIAWPKPQQLAPLDATPPVPAAESTGGI